MNFKDAYNLSSDEQIQFAAQLLSQGEVVGLPTETVYGLAARIDLSQAVEKIFSTKKRPFFDPLIVHVHSIQQAKQLFETWNPIMDLLATKFWPGPLTLVSQKQSSVADVITSGLQTVGVRLPDHPMTLALLKQVGTPLAAPSANLFGQISPTSAQNVKDVFQDGVFVLDGGECRIGIESTIVHVDGDKISLLRPGMISSEKISQSLQEANIHFQMIEPRASIAPGQMKHHYMPSVPLILYSNPLMSLADLARFAAEKLSQIPDEVDHVKLVKPSRVDKVTPLLLSDDSFLAARQLYANLRSAANQNPDVISFLVKPIHLAADWQGVLDRLRKAASLQL